MFGFGGARSSGAYYRGGYQGEIHRNPGRAGGGVGSSGYGFPHAARGRGIGRAGINPVEQARLAARESEFLGNNPDLEFNNVVMRMDEQLDTPYELPNLGASNYGRSSVKYSDFIPFIREEVRATLQQGWQRADSPARNEQQFNLEIVIIEPPHAQKQFRQFRAKIISRLPDDIQGMSLVALRIDVSGKPVDGAKIFLASFDANDSSMVTIKYRSDVYTPAIKVGKIRQACSLGSLVNLQRMYVACKKNYPSFQRQITTFSADALPESYNSRSSYLSFLSPQSSQLDHEIEEFSRLNPLQKQVASAYIRANSGLYQVQGPPGTGKTTFICALLNYLKTRERTLVCAPSNKAVQEVAKRFVKNTGSGWAVLVGVSEKIPPELTDIFLDNLVKNLPNIRTGIFNSLSELGNILNVAREDSTTYFEGTVTTFSVREIALITSNFNRHKTHILDCMKKLSHYHFLQSVPDILSKHQSVLDILAHMEAALPPRQVLGYPPYMRENYLNYVKQLTDCFRSLQYVGGSSLEKLILESAPIVFCTLSTSGRQCLQNIDRKFEHLIVDEAGQSQMPEILIPMHVNPRKCLTIGDPQQLPATVISPACKSHGYEASLMHRMTENRSPMSTLTEQYRMHPEIRLWPSKMYYGGRLSDHHSVTTRRSVISEIIQDWCQPWTFYNLAQGRETLNGSSYINQHEIKFVGQLVAQLNQHGITNQQISVITFYAAQSDEMQRYLGRNSPKVNTVDSFQGSESDVIIISFVRSNPNAAVGFLKDFRRLNVAVTRGKHAVLMVGNQHTLENSDSNDLRSLIQDARSRHLIFNASDFQRRCESSAVSTRQNAPQQGNSRAVAHRDEQLSHPDRRESGHGRDTRRNRRVFYKDAN